MAAMPAPIGSNFKGFGVPEALAGAAATSQPFTETAVGLGQANTNHRKAAEFQQLLSKGLQGVGAYVQEVSRTHPDLGRQFAAEVQSVTPFIQSLDREKATETVLSLYESMNGRLQEAMKPKTGWAPTSYDEAVKFDEAKRSNEANYRAPRPGKADKAADKAKEALANLPRIWKGIEMRINANAAEGGLLTGDQNLANLVSQLHKYETDAKMDLSDIKLDLTNYQSYEGGGITPTLADLMVKPSKSFSLYQNHVKTGTKIPDAEPTVGAGPGGAQSLDSSAGLDPTRKAAIAKLESALAAYKAQPTPDASAIQALEKRIADIRNAGTLSR